MLFRSLRGAGGAERGRPRPRSLRDRGIGGSAPAFRSAPAPPHPPGAGDRLSTSQGRHFTTKVPEVSLKPLPQRTYDRTDEENEAIADADLNKWKAGLKARKEPEPKPVYSEKEQKWAMGMLTGPSQAEINAPDDYRRHLMKLAKSYFP